MALAIVLPHRLANPEVPNCNAVIPLLAAFSAPAVSFFDSADAKLAPFKLLETPYLRDAPMGADILWPSFHEQYAWRFDAGMRASARERACGITRSDASGSRMTGRC